MNQPDYTIIQNNLRCCQIHSNSLKCTPIPTPKCWEVLVGCNILLQSVGIISTPGKPKFENFMFCNLLIPTIYTQTTPPPKPRRSGLIHHPHPSNTQSVPTHNPMIQHIMKGMWICKHLFCRHAEHLRECLLFLHRPT